MIASVITGICVIVVAVILGWCITHIDGGEDADA